MELLNACGAIAAIIGCLLALSIFRSQMPQIDCSIREISGHKILFVYADHGAKNLQMRRIWVPGFVLARCKLYFGTVQEFPESGFSSSAVLDWTFPCPFADGFSAAFELRESSSSLTRIFRKSIRVVVSCALWPLPFIQLLRAKSA